MSNFFELDKDILTLGNYLSYRSNNLEIMKFTNEQKEQLGKEFCNEFHITASNVISKQLHSVCSVQLGIALLTKLAELGCNHAELLCTYLDKAYCKLTLYSDGYNCSGDAFYVRDALATFEKFIVIDDLVSYGTKCGAKLLRSLQDYSKLPLLVQAGYLFYGDYEAAGVTNDFSLLDNLISYYEQNGFKNVNDRIGNYEESCMLLWEPNAKSESLAKISAF